jgi:hypothetical protein
MSKKRTGILLIIAGVLVIVLAFTADLIGLGGDPGFGYIQQGVTAAGAVVLAAGILLLVRKTPEKK